MDYTAAPLEKLIEEFGKFQGVGRKGATRMAYQVLSMSDKDAARWPMPSAVRTPGCIGAASAKTLRTLTCARCAPAPSGTPR